MNILITGGAGYIGAHAVKRLCEDGHDVVVVDDLSSGHRKSVPVAASFYETAIHDEEKMTKILKDHGIEAVMHFAASSLVGESVEKPLHYYYNNVEGTRALLAAMQRSGVRYIVFSSTAAVYGDAAEQPITETAPLAPLNPYGETKRVIEKMLEASAAANDLLYISLRYFNVAGAHADATLGEEHDPETHLIPNILLSTLTRERVFTLFGTDHATEDGTAVRDYIHVEDLIDAHVLALEHLMKTKRCDVFNLGSEKGYSVKEVLETAREVTGADILIDEAPRRQGDPSVLIASHAKAHAVLKWSPRRDLQSMIDSAYRYYLGRNRK